MVGITYHLTSWNARTKTYKEIRLIVIRKQNIIYLLVFIFYILIVMNIYYVDLTKSLLTYYVFLNKRLSFLSCTHNSYSKLVSKLNTYMLCFIITNILTT